MVILKSKWGGPGVGYIDPSVDTVEFHRLSAINGPLINPNRVPSKAAGRRGTRRAWKRAHPPGWFERLFLQGFADQLGLTYEQLTANWPPQDHDERTTDD